MTKGPKVGCLPSPGKIVSLEGRLGFEQNALVYFKMVPSPLPRPQPGGVSSGLHYENVVLLLEVKQK